MDLQSTLQTAAGLLPSNLDISELLSGAAAYIPAELDLVSTAKFTLFFFIGSVVAGGLGRVILGKRSGLNHALSSAMGILLIYALTIIIYTFQPWNLIQYLSPLPYVTFADSFIVISPILGTSLSLFCSQTLSLIILAFLVNLLDTFLPRGESLLSWYLLRFLTVLIAMALHLVVKWACSTYLPSMLVNYAPVLLLIVVLSMLLMGVLNVVLGVVLTAMDPLFGGLYTFFFSNIIGKQITKAVFTSIVICGLLIGLDYLGYTVICITPDALIAYIPFAVILLILWYLIGHLL